jgi:hypothetical protein
VPQRDRRHWLVRESDFQAHPVLREFGGARIPPRKVIARCFSCRHLILRQHGHFAQGGYLKLLIFAHFYRIASFETHKKSSICVHFFCQFSTVLVMATGRRKRHGKSVPETVANLALALQRSLIVS